MRFGRFAISRASVSSVRSILQSIFHNVTAVDDPDDDERLLHNVRADGVGYANVCIFLGDQSITGAPFNIALHILKYRGVGERVRYTVADLYELTYAPYYFKGTWDGDGFSIRVLPYRVNHEEDRVQVDVRKLQVRGPSAATWPGHSVRGPKEDPEGRPGI